MISLFYKRLTAFFTFPTEFSTLFFSKSCLPFPTQSQLLTTPRQMPFENIMGKGENAGHQSRKLPTYTESANVFSLVQSFGKGLKVRIVL